MTPKSTRVEGAIVIWDALADGPTIVGERAIWRDGRPNNGRKSMLRCLTPHSELETWVKEVGRNA
jgi:hypothetical protein